MSWFSTSKKNEVVVVEETNVIPFVESNNNGLCLGKFVHETKEKCRYTYNIEAKCDWGTNVYIIRSDNRLDYDLYNSSINPHMEGSYETFRLSVTCSQEENNDIIVIDKCPSRIQKWGKLSDPNLTNDTTCIYLDYPNLVITCKVVEKPL
jgi:hypothetical protein